MGTSLDLSDAEKDAVAEIANVGVSRAAASLRHMVGDEVLLSVPEVSIVSRQSAARMVGGEKRTGWWPCASRSKARFRAARC